MEFGPLFYGIIVMIVCLVATVCFFIFIVGSVREDKKSRLTKTAGFMAVIFGLLFFILNSSGSSEITAAVEGTYKLEYPSGQIELLTIKKDNSIVQKFYSNATNYDNDKILFDNTGTWTISDEEISFNNWMTICYLARNIDSIIPKPKFTSLSKVRWYGSTSVHPDRIDIWSEDGYVLEKISP
jgi:hypothetical protein